jgi:hypothetical protein
VLGEVEETIYTIEDDDDGEENVKVSRVRAPLEIARSKVDTDHEETI